MVEFVASIRPFFEIAYFVAGILLIFGLALTYRQLRLIQKDMDTRSDRAAKEKAIEACLRYGNAFVPVSTKLYLAFEAANLKPTYTGPIGDFSSKSVVSRRLSPEIAKNMQLMELFVDTLNELNAFAAYFVTEVADEKVGFATIGRSYCRTVESHYDLISLARDKPAEDYWYPIVKLYGIWRPRLEKSELQAKARVLQGRIDKLNLA